jgi:protein-S-isoprenylcysteine O-methyltransferase Ste14
MLQKVGVAVLLAGLVAEIAIRWPHDARRQKTPVAHNQRGALELVLLAAVSIGVMLLPVVYAFTRLFAFADYPFHAAPFAAGCVLLAAAIYVFYRSHADLGTNWSPTLELREEHALVENGIYRRIRHPMYASLFLYVFAQACLVPNFLVGAAGIVAFTAMYALRVGVEERMMIARFGDAYRAYARRTKRLVPGLF